MKNWNVLLVGIVFFFGIQALAAPKKYNARCEVAKRIVEPENSSGFHMSEDCKTVYVLPPQTGTIKVQAYQSFVDDAICANIDSLKSDIRALNHREKDLLKELERTYDNNPKIRELKASCNNLINKEVEGQAYIKIAKLKLDRAKSEYNTVMDKKLACESKQNTAEECAIVEMDLDNAKYDLDRMQEKYDRIEDKVEEVTYKKDACISIRDIRLSTFLVGLSELNIEKTEIEAERRRLTDLLKIENTASQSEIGAMYAVTLLSDQTAMVNAFDKANEGINLDFTHMPIKQGLVSFNLVKSDGFEDVVVIRKSNINGIKANTSFNMTDVKAMQPAESKENENIFGQAAAGDIEITKFGACALRDKVIGQTDENAAKTVAQFLSPTISYQYEVQVDRSFHVKYEESHLYQIIKKHKKSKSGLFKSKSVSSVTEKVEASKWIDIEFDSQDSDHQWQDVQKMAMDIRKEYVDSALMKVAKGYLNGKQLAMQEAGPNAAQEAAPILREKCAYAYCQYAAVALDLGNALFGGSTSESNMTKIVKLKAGEKVVDKKMVTAFGTQSLVVEK